MGHNVDNGGQEWAGFERMQMSAGSVAVFPVDLDKKFSSHCRDSARCLP